MDEYKWYPDDYQLNIEPKKPQTALVVSNTPNKKKPKRPKKPWVVALVTALITSLVCSTAFAAILFTPAVQSLGSPIIYRDGNDLREKVDGSQLIGGTTVNSDGKSSMSVVDIARQVGPAVVGIISTSESTNGIFFLPTEQESSGSGIIISSDGYIVTNNHVVENAKSIKVVLSTKEEYDAKLVGTDPQTDLAVIKIEATGLTSAVLGNSSDVQVGELAIAIGNPLGQELAGTVTTGIISATNRTITVEGKTYNLLQTDAAINSGNSGGALVNAYGEVIGINSVKLASTGVEGLGFAIPSDTAKPIISDLINYGYVQGRPSMGLLSPRNITQEISQYYNLPIGVYVTDVAAFSAAEKAGIKPGDVIIRADGQEVTTVTELSDLRDKHKAGETMALTIMRSGEQLEITLTLEEDKSNVPTGSGTTAYEQQ